MVLYLKQNIEPLIFERKRAFPSLEISEFSTTRKHPEKMWISPKIRIFSAISKEKYLQIT